MSRKQSPVYYPPEVVSSPGLIQFLTLSLPLLERLPRCAGRQIQLAREAMGRTHPLIITKKDMWCACALWYTMTLS